MTPASAPLRMDSARSLPVLDTARLRTLEQSAAAELAPNVLMSRAGTAVARLARARFAFARRVLVLCGPGNNGGDGMVAAAALASAGIEVDLVLVARPPQPGHAWNWALQQALAAGLEPHIWNASWVQTALTRCELVLDALLGIGLSRPPDAELAQAIELLEQRRCPLLAVDLPSGLQSDTGCAPGKVVHADVTLTLLGLKPGLFGGLAASAVGELWFDDLGVQAPLDGMLALNDGASILRCLPRPATAAHKGERGDVHVFGGAAGMGGALLLCGRSALVLGAGRVYCAALDPDAAAIDPACPELMLRQPQDLLRQASSGGRGSLVFGPGAGMTEAAAELLLQLLQRSQALLIDADGINLLAAAGASSTLWQALRARRAPTWLTPHPGEAAAMLGCSVAQVQQDRLAAARALQGATGAGIVLKGQGSLIADRDGTTHINASGNGLLASAGSGDVLSGAIAALLAAGHGSAGVRAAVWLHGAAADLAARRGRLSLCAGELPALMEQAWGERAG